MLLLSVLKSQLSPPLNVFVELLDAHFATRGSVGNDLPSYTHQTVSLSTLNGTHSTWEISEKNDGKGRGDQREREKERKREREGEGEREFLRKKEVEMEMVRSPRRTAQTAA